MAALTTGGWFAIVVIDKLADQVTSYIQRQWAYPAGVEAKLQKLEQHLTRIKAVIHIVHNVQIENPSLFAWFRDLKDAAYTAEDVLDNIEYQILEDKVKGLNQMHSDIISSSSAISRSARTVVKRFFFRDEVLNELDAVVKKFDEIASSIGLVLELLKFDMGARRDDLQWRVTTSMPTEPEIVGRKDQIEYLVKLLTERKEMCATSNKKFDVISIQGIGGVGKTTLAQAVYDNDIVKQFFDIRVWVCVSDDFDILRITKEIIESAPIRTQANFHMFSNLDTVQGFLGRGLMEKRFLIVLDDVWDVVCTTWEKLQAPLKCGREGSKVIITTRNLDTTNMMAAGGTIALEGLEGNDYWLFFKQCAFGNEDPNNHPKLEPIAREIAAKLRGSPLAAKTVGGMLKQNLNEEHWREILQSNIWQLEQGKDGISAALRLSYEHLPAHLKQCFVYCSFFRKDFCFERDDLVRMWMAQGFICPNSGTKRMEDIGRDYFQVLLSRSFFQSAVGRHNKYVVHDLMHDLAQSISADEYCIIKDGEAYEIPKRVRHLFYDGYHTDWLLHNASQLKTLRSLIISQRSSGSQVQPCAIGTFKCLRVLVIEGWNQVLEDLGCLTHLRYLSIQNRGSIGDVNSLSRLYHIQGLRCESGGPWLEEVNQLINLRFLHEPFGQNIPEIGRLTSLQELHTFHVKKRRGHELRQLQGMKHLRGPLNIFELQKVKSKDDLGDSVLINKEHLTRLILTWSSGTSDIEPEEVLESLQPHCNLKELQIVWYPGVKSPSWLDTKWLMSIEIICLQCCRSWKVLPPFGQLPFLTKLRIEGMEAVQQIGGEFYGRDDAFLNLVQLAFVDMCNLEEWSGHGNGYLLFPRLGELTLTNCPKLECLLPVSFLLKKLVITKRRYLRTRQLDTFVLFVGDISLLPRWLPAESLATVQELEIRDLDALPAHLERLHSLERLLIHNCMDIHSLPETGLPASLKELHMKGCHPTLVERCQKDSGPDWPKIAHIPTILIQDILR